MAQPTKTPAPVPDAPVQNDDYLTLCVSINRDLPATPGDKVASRIFKFKDVGIPESFLLWVEPPKLNEEKKPLEWKIVNKSDFLEYEVNDFRDALMKWEGTDGIIISKLLDDNNIVTAAHLPDKPQWRVLIKVDREQPPIAKPWDEKKSTAAPDPVKPNPEQISLIQIAQAQIAEAQITLARVVPPAASGLPNPVVPSPETTSQHGNKSEPILIRLNAELTFDIEKYTIYAYNKWPKGVKRTNDEIKKTIYAAINNKTYDGKNIQQDLPERDIVKYNLYKAISEENDEMIQYFISNRYISTNRLRLDEITEGEWLLPVYIKGESNKKVLLTYIKVKIEWNAREAKTAAPPPKPDASGTAPAKDPGKDASHAK